MPDTTAITVTSAPVTVDTAVRKVAAAVDAFWAQQGATVTWNAARTVATLAETTDQADVNVKFTLRSAGAGKTTLGVSVSFDSPILGFLGATERGQLTQQLEASVNQIAAVVSHLATRTPEVGGPEIAA